MKLNYKIDEIDFLTFQLYTCSKSERIQKKKKKNHILLSAGFFLAAIWFYIIDLQLTAICSFIYAVFTALFYPRFFNKKHKKHYQSYIREHYAQRFGTTEELEFNNKTIASKDKVGEGYINLDHVELINEIESHYFIKISTGQSIIIPKKQISNNQEFKTHLKSLGLKINNDTNWKWA